MPAQEPRQQPTVTPLSARDVSAHYRALADATRLRIVRVLWEQSDRTVTDLCGELRLSQPLMSWHLRILRRAGLVKTYRTGRQVHCVLQDEIVSEYGALLERYLASAEEPEPAALPRRAMP